MALNPNITQPGSLVYEAPFYDAAAISTGTAFTACRAIYNGTNAQDIAVTLVSGNKVTFKAVPVGTILRVAGTLVDSGPTNLLALY